MYSVSIHAIHIQISPLIRHKEEVQVQCYTSLHIVALRGELFSKKYTIYLDFMQIIYLKDYILRLTK